MAEKQWRISGEGGRHVRLPLSQPPSRALLQKALKK